jgi:hypothetical protein
MKKFIVCFVLIAGTLSVYSQTQIKLEDAKNHIGDSVTVCGKVYSARFVSNATNEPTFLNLGAKYPDQLLTIVIWSDVRKQFKGNPEDIFLNKEICVTGKVELFRDKPQIVIKKLGGIKTQNL